MASTKITIRQALELVPDVAPEVVDAVVQMLESPQILHNGNSPAAGLFLTLPEQDLKDANVPSMYRSLVRKAQKIVRRLLDAASDLELEQYHEPLGCMLSPTAYLDSHMFWARTAAQLSARCRNPAELAAFRAYLRDHMPAIHGAVHGLQGQTCGAEPDEDTYKSFGDAILKLAAVMLTPVGLHCQTFVHKMAADGTRPELYIVFLPEGENLTHQRMYTARYAFCGELLSAISWATANKQDSKIAQLMDRFHRMLGKAGDGVECLLVGVAGDGRYVRPFFMKGQSKESKEKFELFFTESSHDLAGAIRVSRRRIWRWDADGVAVKELVYLLFQVAEHYRRMVAAAEAEENILRPQDCIKVGGVGKYKVLEVVKSSAAGGVYRCVDLTSPSEQRVFVKHDALAASLRATDYLCSTHPSALQAETSAGVATQLGEAATDFGVVGAGVISDVMREDAGLSSGLVGTFAFISRDLGTRLLDSRSHFKRNPSAVEKLLLDIMLQLAALQTARVLHGDISPANIVIDSLGGFHLIDFGFAVSNSTEVVHMRHSVSHPPGFTPAQNAIAANPMFGSYAAISGKPVSLIDELESLTYVSASMYGSSMPWRASAEAGQISGCIYKRSELRRKAAHAAMAADIGNWVTELPATLQQVMLWVLQRKSATADDGLDLHTALQGEDAKDAPLAPLTPSQLAHAHKQRLLSSPTSPLP